MDVDEEHCSGLLDDGLYIIICMKEEESRLPDAFFICNETGPAKVVFV